MTMTPIMKGMKVVMVMKARTVTAVVMVMITMMVIIESWRWLSSFLSQPDNEPDEWKKAKNEN